MPLDPQLELLVAIVREPDRVAWKEHRRQRDVERERSVVAAAESAADIGRLHADVRRLEGGLRLTKQERERFRQFVGRLRADHQFELLALRVVPGNAALRLEKHRVGGLGLELPIQYEACGIVRRKLGANLLRRGPLLPHRHARPDPATGVQSGRSLPGSSGGLTQPFCTGE